MYISERKRRKKEMKEGRKGGREGGKRKKERVGLFFPYNIPWPLGAFPLVWIIFLNTLERIRYCI
jgi:hypothetical protein